MCGINSPIAADPFGILKLALVLGKTNIMEILVGEGISSCLAFFTQYQRLTDIM